MAPSPSPYAFSNTPQSTQSSSNYNNNSKMPSGRHAPAGPPSSSSQHQPLAPGAFGQRDPRGSVTSVDSNGSGASSSSRKPFAPGYAGFNSAAGRTGSISTFAPSISEKYSISDPTAYHSDHTVGDVEVDDYLHNPDPKRDRKNDKGGSILTLRGLENLGCLAIIILGLIALFAGYPIISFYQTAKPTALGAFNLGGINATGQVPAVIGSFGLIDPATPLDKRTWTSLETGEEMELVFSDEFEEDGRSFFPGDDAYWEAVDLHYWSTNNLEWYDPRQITTKDGALVISLDKIPNHGLDYMGGMISSWRKFCFTGGYLESSVKLPGRPDVYGLWPAVWAMGNLGRAGYGGTLDGMWPYTYDECDVGTLANQTLNGLPTIATTSGNQGLPGEGALSFLPGQRLSRCTCPGDSSHPGPKHDDGTWVGRSAPEIDVFEAQVDPVLLVGHTSQSAQWAPFNPKYSWLNNSANLIIDDHEISELNTYFGGVYQQATSVVSATDQNCYEHGNVPCFSLYGFEYAPGNDGHIHWVSDGKKAWSFRGAGMGPNAAAEVSARPVPMEPMYILINLGLSENFGAIDYEGLENLWPVHLYVEHIRVYQSPNAKNVGCDPDSFPTEKYIERYIHGYTDPNITTWDQMTDSAPQPINRLIGSC
ncbi:beta-glucan synthesis-associated [Mrakia frigida]|uniref:beta-glucan synthesis-associated n=1 Tax=Mrakia frigida TaxID=29902 RepID=UPI003FCC0E12